MTQLFLGSFIVGLLLMVGSMLWGVERRSRTPTAAPTGRQAVRARLTVPNLGAFLTLFGVAGYPLYRYGGLGIVPTLVLAAIVGVAGVVGASLVIARWAVPGVAAEVVDERYVLQGQPARITRVVRDASGAPTSYEVTYEVEGHQRTTRARSLDGSALEGDSDVIIERIEDGYAYVEAWSVVEKRL